ncbi:MAG: nucleotidyltransferase family protein [Deltaproteobacteria bacterium]|nr:nucleotidyltransferase family protein [Deltaproteobacteria bacterium]
MTLKQSIRRRRKEILLLASRHGATDVRLFGSAARGDAGPDSDVDFLVKMEDGRSLLDVSDLVADLQDLLGRKVDVVSEDGLYWLLRRRILKEAQPL